ncbi:MAG: hypothetical protein K0R28_3473, partial [Paenibacillus sp.]|nr:hypothetical protein [Paenibacillus sp.]
MKVIHAKNKDLEDVVLLINVKEW